MPSKPWTEEDQVEFLQSHFDEYYGVQKDGKYTDFWAKVFQAWFTRWPALATKFPGKEVSELTEEDRRALKGTIRATKEVHALDFHSYITDNYFRELKCGTAGESIQRPGLEDEVGALSSPQRTFLTWEQVVELIASKITKCFREFTTRKKSNQLFRTSFNVWRPPEMGSRRTN